MFKKIIITFFLFLASFCLDAKLPQLDASKTAEKIREIMNAHASQRELNVELMKRIFLNYLEQLDPNKTYFIRSDILNYIEPNAALLSEAIEKFEKKDFDVFFELHQKMIDAIERRRKMTKNIDLNHLPKDVKSEEFKDMDWLGSEELLLSRLERIRALQVEAAAKLNDGLREKALQRIEKNQAKFEEEILNASAARSKETIFSNILKAVTSALDAHTAYFTPIEAEQFMINVQLRLFGIGAQLRDDLNGFTVTKIIDGGPAAEGKELKLKDRIVAVNGEPVVGLDIVEAVELIRGKENTEVLLTIIREEGEGEEKKEEERDIKIIRGEVLLKESRYESSHEPYADGAIGYLRLYSFYQDPENSSAVDLAGAIEKLKSDHKLKGLILDLRYNSGGMLSQAVAVTGLFITKGVVVGIKDNTDAIQYLRNLEEKSVWNGPLIVLTNKASASASEIVAQTLQDYGRALVVGDETTYGKGSFQTFTLNSNKEGTINPEGEYKVTRGRYYTVSGKTPQLVGVKADVVLPGPLSVIDVGEKFVKYPLENDSIKDNFDDDLSDVPFLQRGKIRSLYKFDLQPRLHTYEPFLETLQKNAAYRIEKNKNYQTFLKELKKDEPFEDEVEETFGQNDLQLTEAYNIMKDLIALLQQK